MQLLSLAEEDPLILLAGGLTALILFGSLVVLGYWLYRDASARDASGPLWWVFFAFTGIGLLWYLAVRDERDPRAGPPTGTDRLASTWTVAVVLAFGVSWFVTPPDPVTQVLAYPPLFAAAFGLSYLLVYRDVLDRRETPA